MDLLELIRGKKVMVGRSMSPAMLSKPRKRWLEPCARRWRSSMPTNSYPSTNCGMAPLPRHVATGKLHALSAGAEIIRRELAAK